MSDTGWGCMLRCGQMILAEALLRRHLGRGMSVYCCESPAFIFPARTVTVK